MKSKLKFLLLALVALIVVLSLASCKKQIGNAEDLHKATDGGEIEVTNNKVSKYKGEKSKIEISNDFTIDTSDDFFTAIIGNFRQQNFVPGRILEKSVINGNGHTITITGSSDGKLGRYASGLFARLMNCEVRDLHIVYDIEVNLNNKNSMGGICAVAENTTFTNCTVTYKKGAGFYGYRGGGLAGAIYGGKIENCAVYGDFKTNASYFGGIVGGISSDGVINNCTFKGAIRANDLHNAEIGGVAGYVDGKLTNTKAILAGFSVSGKTDKWTNYEAYCGALAGKIYKQVENCLVEFTDGAYIESIALSDGVFRTIMHTGAVAGYASKDASIKNVLIDGMADLKMNVNFPDKSTDVALGIYKNECNNIEKVYYLDNPFSHNLIRRETSTLSGDVYSFTMKDKECKVTLVKTPHPDDPAVYKISALIFTVSGVDYHLTTKVDDNPLKPCFKANIDGFCYQVTASYEGGFVDFSKTHNRTPIGGATCVTDYAEVVFDSDVWTTDEFGKVTLK